jgi:DNA polymerase-3 subunit delta
MKINFEQLTGQLQKKLFPVYLITGNEPLLIQEAQILIRSAAQQANYLNRESFTVNASFDWNQLLFQAQSLSLFSEKSLLELNLGNAKPGTAGNKILQTYLKNPPMDKILIIIADKLEASTQKTAWFNAIDAQGLIVQIWPCEAQQLPQWLSQRLQQAGLKIDAEGLKLLSSYCEGNLLAAKQTIEKLKLLLGNSTTPILTAEMIADSIADNARFDVFKLIDELLQGNIKQSTRILSSLKQQAVEPTLILWAITRELRNLIIIKSTLNQGRPLDQAMQQQQIWNKRKPLIHKATQRHTQEYLQSLLSHAKQIDQLIKGISLGNVWDELLRVCLGVCKEIRYAG